MFENSKFGLSETVKIKVNLPEAPLIEYALKHNEQNQLSADGALVIRTGKFTGRAAGDKYIVEDAFSQKVIDWKNNVRKMSPEHFQAIKLEMLDKFNTGKRTLFASTRSVVANPAYALGVNLITPSASHALFSINIFREEQQNHPMGSFTIYHDPEFLVDTAKYPIKSSTVIVTNFLTKEIIIAGTGYAGEVKKSIFSVLNTILPEHGILPMHTGANQDKTGQTSLFFGLSGTGKTTLSTDINVDIIGDDEHGMANQESLTLKVDVMPKRMV